MSFIWAPLFPQETADQLLHKMASKGTSGELKTPKGETTAAKREQFFGKLMKKKPPIQAIKVIKVESYCSLV